VGNANSFDIHFPSAGVGNPISTGDRDMEAGTRHRLDQFNKRLDAIEENGQGTERRH
jgi:hypothetical protein